MNISLKDHRRAKVKSLKAQILEALMASRHGLIAPEILEAIGGTDNFESFRSYLSILVHQGVVRTDGKHTCDHCGNAKVVYRIAEQGRMYLRARELA